MLTRRRLIALPAGSALALSLSGRAAWAQTQSLDWPNRAVRFIVPFAAGGPTDIVARVVTEQLSKIWGQQAVIENRGGAGTNIGNEMAARSDPDGYTVLFATASLAVNRSLYRSLSYDPIADFKAVSLVSRFSLFMFVPNSLPTRSVMEFVAYAKVHPGKLTLASPGTGSTPQTPPEIVRKMSVDTIAALGDPVVKSKLEQAGYMVVGSSPDELKTLLKSEVDKWSAIIKTARIKIN